MSTKIRKKPSSSLQRWILARKAVQLVALVAFLLLIVLSRSGAVAPWVASAPMRLDPLAQLSSLLAGRALLAGGALALVTLLLALVVGRAWCGWLCPLGTLLDIFSPRNRAKDRPPPESWRKIKYVVLLVVLFAALMGNLTLLVLDPLTLLYRSFTAALWPAMDRLVTALETGLYRVPFLSTTVVAFDSLVRPVLLSTLPVYYRGALFIGLLLAGVILLNRFAGRFWCRYLCPLGGMLGLIGKISLFKREVSEDCRACTLCSAACPTGAIDPQQSRRQDAGECILCLDCLEACPRGSIRLAAGFKPSPWQPYNPSRRDVLGALGVSLATLALFRSEAHVKRPNQFLLRPPGSTGDRMLSACVRCGACLATCPTGALQPALLEAGLEGLWTPLVVPRMGACDYSCHACGQVCPVGAIPPLELTEKRLQIIGKAYLDESRCIAWSDHQDCIVCEEMCPLPQKAIFLTQVDVVAANGAVRPIQLPHVDRELCTGCGICENRCPVSGEAAVRVYIPPSDEGFW